MKKCLISIILMLCLAGCGKSDADKSSGLLLQYQGGKVLRIDNDTYICYKDGQFIIELYYNTMHGHMDITSFIEEHITETK